VTQAPSIYGDLTVHENVAYFASILGAAPGQADTVNTEFQADQFLSAFVLRQLLLCGLFAPRNHMAAVLRGLSDLLPLSYAVDGVSRVATSGTWTTALTLDLAVVVACVPLALALGAATLRRQTP
jgi:ABC-2 type transport system permease protein